MKNNVKFSITVLENERFIADGDFTEQDEKELISELESKYGGKIDLVETRLIAPVLIKNGD